MIVDQLAQGFIATGGANAWNGVEASYSGLFRNRLLCVVLFMCVFHGKVSACFETDPELQCARWGFSPSAHQTRHMSYDHTSIAVVVVPAAVVVQVVVVVVVVEAAATTAALQHSSTAAQQQQEQAIAGGTACLFLLLSRRLQPSPSRPSSDSYEQPSNCNLTISLTSTRLSYDKS